MQLTKFEHSCLDIKEGDSRLVIDPGVFSPSFKTFDGIIALVITHIHPDHFNPENVTKILAANPKVKIFTTQEVADEIKNPAVEVPKTGQEYVVGAFTLEFFGGQHAAITPSYPTNQNYGVLVNGKLYHPGDSLTVCEKPHQVLSLPIMAPWLKFSDTAEFISKHSATTLVPTHNGFINADGQALYDRLAGMVAEQAGKTYKFLAPGQSLDI